MEIGEQIRRCYLELSFKILRNTNFQIYFKSGTNEQYAMESGVVFRGQNFAPLLCLENDTVIVFENYTGHLLSQLIRVNLFGISFFIISIISGILYAISSGIVYLTLEINSDVSNNVIGNLSLGIFLVLLFVVLGLKIPWKVYHKFRYGIDRILFFFKPSFVDIFLKKEDLELIQVLDRVNSQYLRITPLYLDREFSVNKRAITNTIDGQTTTHHHVIEIQAGTDVFELANFRFKQENAPEQQISNILFQTSNEVKGDYRLKQPPSIRYTRYAGIFNKSLRVLLEQRFLTLQTTNIALSIILSLFYYLGKAAIYFYLSVIGILLAMDFIDNYTTFTPVIRILYFPIVLILLNTSISLLILAFLEIAIRNPTPSED